MNYQTLTDKELQIVVGGGQYDKAGYNLGKSVGTFVRKAAGLWGLFK